MCCFLATYILVRIAFKIRDEKAEKAKTALMRIFWFCAGFFVASIASIMSIIAGPRDFVCYSETEFKESEPACAFQGLMFVLIFVLIFPNDLIDSPFSKI